MNDINAHNLDILNRAKIYSDDNAYLSLGDVESDKKSSQQLGVDKEGRLYTIDYKDNYGFFNRIKRFFKRRFGDQRASKVSKAVVDALNSTDITTRSKLDFKVRALAQKFTERYTIGATKEAKKMLAALKESDGSAVSNAPAIAPEQFSPTEESDDALAASAAETLAALEQEEDFVSPNKAAAPPIEIENAEAAIQPRELSPQYIRNKEAYLHQKNRSDLQSDPEKYRNYRAKFARLMAQNDNKLKYDNVLNAAPELCKDLIEKTEALKKITAELATQKKQVETELAELTIQQETQSKEVERKKEEETQAQRAYDNLRTKHNAVLEKHGISTKDIEPAKTSSLEAGSQHEYATNKTSQMADGDEKREAIKALTQLHISAQDLKTANENVRRAEETANDTSQRIGILKGRQEPLITKLDEEARNLEIEIAELHIQIDDITQKAPE